MPILKDSVFEGDETINLALSNPSGAILGAQDTAVLTILGNRAPTANNQGYSMDEDTHLPITLTGSDPDADSIISYEITGNPSDGELSGFNPTAGNRGL